MNTKPKKLSSVDIARLSGVSQATVSRVLSGGEGVKPATKEKVMQVVKAHGYRPNAFAQAMRTNQSAAVGVAVSRVTNPIVPEILEALTRSFTAKGRRVVVWNTDENGQDGLISAIRSGLVDGLVFTAANQQSEAAKAAHEADMPLVSINRSFDELDCDQVVSTNHQGAFDLADYLVKCGRKKVAFVNGPKDRTTLADREQGFREGLTAAGIAPDSDLFFSRPFKDNAFRQLGMDIFGTNNPPDAIACGNDLIAIQIMNGLKAAGCRVPEDIWVVGFDGIEMAGWDIISLTTVQQPIELMANNAATFLLDRIEGKRTETETIQYRTELKVRETTGFTPAP